MRARAQQMERPKAPLRAPRSGNCRPDLYGLTVAECIGVRRQKGEVWTSREKRCMRILTLALGKGDLPLPKNDLQRGTGQAGGNKLGPRLAGRSWKSRGARRGAVTFPSSHLSNPGQACGPSWAHLAPGCVAHKHTHAGSGQACPSMP
jgi:hypothetical protein